MIMTRLIKRSAACLIAAAILIPAMVGCGSKTENSEKPAENIENQVDKTENQAEGTEKPEDNVEKPEENAEAVEVTGTAEEETAQNTEISEVSYDFTVDYKTSEMYSREDMDKAISEILKEFDTWDGCVMKKISYSSDEKCRDNLDYINTLAVDTEYDECIFFISTFHSPVEGGDAWEPDYDYDRWEWYLGRTDGGNWDLLTWGY